MRSERDELLWSVLRFTVAALIAAHGVARLLADAVTPFGEWLNSLGFVIGSVIAWGITIFEIVGPVMLALRRYVFPLTLAFSAIYLTGIALVHAPAGWFVVGLGRNGAEYSVLLIVVLMCVGLRYRALPQFDRKTAA